MSDEPSLATDLCLTAIDKVAYLRTRMEVALTLLEGGDIESARALMQDALAETDVGKMKVWLAGEEPF